MEKTAFNKITKEVFTKYGFLKKKDFYVLKLNDVTIVVKFRSWRGVKSFNYWFSINQINDCTLPDDKKGDTLIEIKMEHNLSAQGYHRHEILFEEYTEEEYREMLTNMLHSYFDVYKENAFKYLRDNDYRMSLNI